MGLSMYHERMLRAEIEKLRTEVEKLRAQLADLDKGEDYKAEHAPGPDPDDPTYLGVYDRKD